MIEYTKELTRIAKGLDNKRDIEILMAAACQLIPMVTPVFDKTEKIEGYGYLRTTEYK